MQDLLLSVLIAVDVGLASESCKATDSELVGQILSTLIYQLVNGNAMPKCTIFKYLSSVVKTSKTCEENVSHSFSVDWLKWKRNSGVRACATKTQVKSLYNGGCGLHSLMFEAIDCVSDKFGRVLTTIELKM